MPEGMTNLNQEDGVSDYYEVRPLNLNDKAAKKAALRELQIMQTQCLSDYKTWAKEYVKYQDFGKGKNVDVKLKQCNDQYTMSILMSCIGPLREGISFSSVFTSYLTYNMAKMSNPNMDEDMSRLLLNFREGLMSASETADGKSKFFINKLIKHTDKLVLESSTELMNNNIANNLRTHELDSLVMSPRQLAILKLNFMEQFYVDSRSIGSLSKIENRDKYFQLQDDYNTAIRHIEAIANNSGYNMDVVAVEERYFVGLKMETNPDYANIFSETQEAFGITPVYDEGDGKMWSGRFQTSDGHNYTTGGSKVGTFSPRKPFGLSFQSDEYEEAKFTTETSILNQKLGKISQLFQSAMVYVDSDDLELSKSEKAEMKKGIVEASERYKNQLRVQLKDDGVYNGDIKQIDKYLDETFPDLSDDKSSYLEDALKEDAMYQQFDGNVRYVVEKEILNAMRDDLINKCRLGAGSSIRNMRRTPGDRPLQNEIAKWIQEKGEANITSRQDIPDEVAKAHLALSAHRRSSVMGISEERTKDEVLRDSVDNYIDGMTTEERVDLILHTCSNMLSIKEEDAYRPPKYTVWTTEEERRARRGDPDVSKEDTEEKPKKRTREEFAEEDTEEESEDKSNNEEDDGPDV